MKDRLSMRAFVPRTGLALIAAAVAGGSLGACETNAPATSPVFSRPKPGPLLQPPPGLVVQPLMPRPGGM